MSKKQKPVSFILGPDSPVLNYLREVPQRLDVRRGLIVVAWARQSGVGLLYSALAEHRSRIDVVVGMSGRGTSAEALAHLRALFRRTFVYHKHHRQTFHPKLYLFDDGGSPPVAATLLVGSSNLTAGGLFQNIESNLALDLRPSCSEVDRRLYESVVEAVDNLIKAPFCEELTTDERIYELLDDRYISTEKALGQKRALEGKLAARRGQLRQRPEAPPPPLPRFKMPPLGITFGEVNEQRATSVISTEPAPVIVNRPEFYVRTLTANDVKKLHGQRTGTAEWDIGETARNAMPSFWGWPDQYVQVLRRQERLEWSTTGILLTSLTPKAGVDVDIVLWYRGPRPGHAAEHRLGVRPRPKLIKAAPDDFDTTSLVVLERLPPDRNHTFLIQLLTKQDPGYEDYEQYLLYARPQHRYGYGM